MKTTAAAKDFGKSAEIGKQLIPGTTVYDSALPEHLRLTNQHLLPQAQILKNCLAAISDEGLAEAYLRGSFSSGEADRLSDMDLFLVVEPERISQIYDNFTNFLRDEYDIMVSCHDKLVKDYGGIGFMFICSTREGHSFQLDLYMAMKGITPKSPLFDCPRIFSKDPSYCWVAEKQHQNTLPETAQAFINKMTSQESKSDRMDYFMNDAMVALYIMNKHLQRGQNARALNDNNHLMGLGSEMMLAHNGEISYHSALYSFDKVMATAAQSQDAVIRETAHKFSSMTFMQPSVAKIVGLFDAYKTMHAHSCNGQSQISDSIACFERYLIEPVRHIKQDNKSHMALRA